ncbi:hypothetical protein DS893_08235 [Vibrionales bacterium C3R12]|uniref:hypothetical protein n=1 Tax=Vibrio cortegadensis TaxID=1328770 RepID=UPI000DEB5695|nr:hypothetical protein DS893_08235 [Vibrionales bacterium C3R12]
MKSSSRSKSIAIVSAVIFVLGLLSLNVNQLGLAPIFVIVIAFFTMLVHGFLHFSGRKNGDAFEAYQDSQKTKAEALESSFNNRK